MGISENVIVIKKRKFDKPFPVPRKKVLNYYKLYKSDYLELTKIRSPLLYAANAIFILAIIRICEIIVYCWDMGRIHIESRDGKFLILTGLSAILLFIGGQFIWNPKRKMLRRIARYFEEIDQSRSDRKYE